MIGARCRLLLHIGAPKTGSTALQAFLCDNREALARAGWLYPEVSLRGYGHHDLAFLIGGGYPAWATPQQRPLSALLSDLAAAAAGPERLILSSENFYLLTDPSRVADALKTAGLEPEKTTILVYVRRQDDAHVAWYNQLVKAQGYSGTLDECMSQWQALWDYASLLGRWEAAFGAENLVVRPYQDAELAGGDIRRDLLNVLSARPDDFHFAASRVNTRLTRDVLEFQRLVNRLPLSAQERRRFHRELMDLSTATQDAGLFADAPLLTNDARRAVLAHHASGNARVARRYLGREELFDETLPDGGLPTDPAPLTPEKLTYILGWILARSTHPTV